MIETGSFSGHFELKTFNAYTGELTQKRSFPNLVTNLGLMSYASRSSAFSSVVPCVGNGTTAPSPDDTTLSSFLQRASYAFPETWQRVIAPVAPNWVSGVSATARFNAGMFDGTELTEVGITSVFEPGNLVWCRALIVDEQGRPSSITVLTNEYLDVTYTLYYHPKLTDTEFQFTMNNVTYNCVARVAQVNVAAIGNYIPLCAGQPYGIRIAYGSQTLGEITGTPDNSEGGGYINSALWDDYSSQDPYSLRCKSDIPLNAGNFDGGIGSILVTNAYTGEYNHICPRTQISFSPKIPKDANTEITLAFSRVIGRWTPPTP